MDMLVCNDGSYCEVGRRIKNFDYICGDFRREEGIVNHYETDEIWKIITI